MRTMRQHGFTLVELMVVTAIVGVLLVVAVLALDPDSYSKSARGYAEEVTATLENVRIRATATRKWQRVRVYADKVEHMEAAEPGMAEPTGPDAYYLVQTLTVPRGVTILALSDQTSMDPDGALPDPGDGLDGAHDLDFAPDGAGTAGTIFLEDDEGNRYRIAVFRATGLARLYDDW